jgi:hypothetical protein
MIYAIRELKAYDHIQLKVNGNTAFQIKEEPVNAIYRNTR